MRFLFLPILLIFASCANANTLTSYEEIASDPSKAAGLYYLYPVTESVNTPAPKGYKPFYISHYGRHGSRYLVGKEQYIDPAVLFAQAEKAGALTEKGKEVKRRLDVILADATGRDGELTAIGVKQHHDIAQRMYRAFPEVFKGNPTISAISTTRMRCAHSMAAFCEGLKELNPDLVIPRESAERYMKYMSNVCPQASAFTRWDGPAAQRSAQFQDEVTEPDRLMAELFVDPSYPQSVGKNPKELMLNLFRIAMDAPNTECPERLDDLFTTDELFKLWQNYNYHYYIEMSNPTSAAGAVLDNARPLLSNILESADAAIARGDNGADLRFGHDSCIVPLLGLMKVEGCYGSTDDPNELHKVYADFKISPMAANLQMVFFRDKKGDILVKMMLNEREMTIDALPTETAPFYRWNELRDYFVKILNEK